MKYNKIYFGVILIMLMLVSGVIAMTTHETETYNKIDTFISKVRYAIAKGLFFFTSWGQANCCATDDSGYCEQTGDYVGYDEKWSYGTERVDCGDGGCSYDKCAIDTWAQRICLGGKCSHPSSPSWSNYEGEERGTGASFRGDVSNQWYFSEIYCCPKSCPIEPEKHDTRAYRCENNEWVYKGRYDYDEYCSYAGSGNDYQCWCANEDKNFYISESGNVGCYLSSPSSWCAPFEEHASYTCYNDDIWWYDNNNNRNDKKEECEYGCVSGGDACNPEPEPEPECKSHGEACIPGLGQCCSGLTCFGICLGEEEYTKHYTKCYSGDVYWYDSLNKRNDKYRECGTLGCSGGECKTEPEGKTCKELGGECHVLFCPSGYDKIKDSCAIGTICCVPEGQRDEPSLCKSGADKNKDNVISRSELGVYINKWVNNQVTRNKLGQSISEWVDGGC